MGLHFGVHASHKHSLVQHTQLSHDRAVPLRHGGYDHTAHTAQRHCQVQPGEHRATRINIQQSRQALFYLYRTVSVWM